MQDLNGEEPAIDLIIKYDVLGAKGHFEDGTT